MTLSMPEPWRPAPGLPAEAMKTYRVSAPIPTHFRPATCAEIDCPHYLHGWRTRIEHIESDPAVLHTARNSGRRYTEVQVAEGETYLVFEAGQKCFGASDHKTPVGKPELYLIQGGDHRGNPLGTKPRLLTPTSWRDDFGEHQENLADRIKEG
jgi:hypothetical protein